MTFENNLEQLNAYYIRTDGLGTQKDLPYLGQEDRALFLRDFARRDCFLFFRKRHRQSWHTPCRCTQEVHGTTQKPSDNDTEHRSPNSHLEITLCGYLPMVSSNTSWMPIFFTRYHGGRDQHTRKKHNYSTTAKAVLGEVCTKSYDEMAHTITNVAIRFGAYLYYQ